MRHWSNTIIKIRLKLIQNRIWMKKIESIFQILIGIQFQFLHVSPKKTLIVSPFIWKRLLWFAMYVFVILLLLLFKMVVFDIQRWRFAIYISFSSFSLFLSCMADLMVLTMILAQVLSLLQQWCIFWFFLLKMNRRIQLSCWRIWDHIWINISYWSQSISLSVVEYGEI